MSGNGQIPAAQVDGFDAAIAAGEHVIAIRGTGDGTGRDICAWTIQEAVT
jgi:hypothetical protein